MTFTEYAERILFSDDLEEKLRLEPLDTLIDEPETAFARAIPASKTPEPGRPVTLVPRKPREHDRAPLPSRPQLVEEESRGTLFHFFGNHEMLASELMALALLKFPDAPAEFRAGLLRTLREEQRHTRWYVERMRECGVPFGSQPVSRFFWDAVAPMETPLDYVTRLCLTFEQANLDYARHYGAILREAGDTKSARILERIYEDEIGHVGYGLTWFRRWKSRDETDWEAFRKHLAFPLSPSRAKGNGAAYNAEGRIAAGLDPDFVRELSVFERSKGRTPTVHWFNPDAEDVVAAPSLAAYHPRQTIERFIADLETLPAFLARRDDVVLVRAIPTRAHRERLRRLGIDLPEFEALDAETGGIPPGSLIARRKIAGFRPWAWCPRAAELFAPLRANLTRREDRTARLFSEERRRLFSKIEQVLWWREKADPEFPSIVCEGLDAIDGAVARLREDWGPETTVVLKHPYAASGRGLVRIRPGETLSPNRVGSATQQGWVVVEPWVERVFDYSAQFERDHDGATRRLGFTRQIVDGNGRHLGNLAGPKFCRGLPEDLARFLMREVLPAYDPGEPLVREMERWLGLGDHRGPAGIDAFVYRDPRDGSLKARTVCEINARATMGRVTLELSRRAAPNLRARFSIERRSAAALAEGEPALDAQGKLGPGAVILNDPESAGEWLAILRIEPLN